MKLLFAEDEVSMAEAVTDILTYHNYSVDTVYNGADALDYARTENYDGIFLDIMMPKKNGYEATLAIRGIHDRPDARTIPIIAMTANAFVGDVQASLDAGMNGHLAKPIVMEEVVKSIARNLTFAKRE